MRTVKFIAILLLFASCEQLFQSGESGRKHYLQEQFKGSVSNDNVKSELQIGNNMIDEVHVTDGRKNIVSMKDFIDSVYYIKLETTDASLIGHVDKIYQDDQYIYIIDKKYAREIFVFDHNGHFISKVSRKGPGPEEYNEITDATVDINKHDIIVLDRSKLRLFRYSISGRMESNIKIPFYISSIDFLPADASVVWVNNYMPNDHNTSIYNYALFTADAAGKVYNKGFPFSAEQALSGNYSYSNIRYLTHANGNIYYTPRLSDTIYRVSSQNRVDAVFKLDLEGHGFSASDRSALTNKLYEEKMKEPDFFLFNSDYVINDRFLYAAVLNGTTDFGSFYDMQTKQQRSFTGINVNIPNAILFNFPYASTGSFFVTILEAPNIVDTQAGLAHIDKKDPAIVRMYKGVHADDNPILMYYSLKPFLK